MACYSSKSEQIHGKSTPLLLAPAPNAARNMSELITMLPPSNALMGADGVLPRGPPLPCVLPLVLLLCFAFHSATALASS